MHTAANVMASSNVYQDTSTLRQSLSGASGRGRPGSADHEPSIQPPGGGFEALPPPAALPLPHNLWLLEMRKRTVTAHGAIVRSIFTAAGPGQADIWGAWDLPVRLSSAGRCRTWQLCSCVLATAGTVSH